MVRWGPGSFPFPRALVRPWRRVHPRIHKGDGRERGGRDSDLGHRDGAGVDAEPRIRFDERRGDVERGKLRRYVLRSAIRGVQDHDPVQDMVATISHRRGVRVPVSGAAKSSAKALTGPTT